MSSQPNTHDRERDIAIPNDHEHHQHGAAPAQPKELGMKIAGGGQGDGKADGERRRDDKRMGEGEDAGMGGRK